jgi:hypothetical protein
MSIALSGARLARRRWAAPAMSRLGWQARLAAAAPVLLAAWVLILLVLD